MQVITTTQDLQRFCSSLASAAFVTVDTEFIREKTFWPQLCLVQIAGPDEAAVIDPLAEGIDLSSLAELLVNPKVLKVFHAARQDVEIFLHLFGAVPTPLFDTQVAAMVCGFGESVGYETLAAKLAKARIDKSLRFTDWARRPLSDRQLAYALSDVTHLRVAYEKLAARLERTGRTVWVAEEMGQLADPDTYIVPPELFWPRLKPRSTNPRFLAILREVAAWREREARERDLPRGRVIRDESLVEIAAHAPKSIDELAQVRGLSRSQAEGKWGQALLAAVATAQALPDSDCPHLDPKSEPPKGIGPLVELLRVLLKTACDKEDVAQKLVASQSDLEAIAADDAADVPALHGWRFEVFGQLALELKHGRLGLTCTPDGKAVRMLKLDGNGASVSS
ncbi:Ribonuclease D [Rhodospirillaceae bacterium LM-1]|nr:Ribonuclease D [Rhodospirillaceae bacterium LM-1]